MALSGELGSYWVASSPGRVFEPLAGKVEVDVAIIGGGWVGLLTADLLKREKRRVAVIEARRAAEQVTGHTTAKLTSLHGLIYADLVSKIGESGARLYGEANQQAIEDVVRMVGERGIECDLKREPAYTLSEDGSSLEQIKQEAEVAARLGLPAAFVSDLPLPFATAGAVRFDAQAQLHPLKFIRVVAHGIPGDGSQLFEETRALQVEYGHPHRVITDRGTVVARDVIIATNLPFPLRGGFFAKVFPYRHEVLAAPLPPGGDLDGMFLRVDEPTYSFRTHREGERVWLIAVGPSFKTGSGDSERQAKDLEAYVRSRFGIQQVAYRWGNQDYFSPDRIPLVGRIDHEVHRVYVATGFGAWGLSNGMVAARILCDKICERRNPWADLYDSTRLHLRVTGGAVLRENLHVGRHWIMGRVQRWRVKDVCDVPMGEGAICRHNGELVAVYKGEDGKVHRFSPNCTHLGCHVSWNSAEKSWDCACHGSRFSPDGNVINGPAVRDLERKPRE